ncbi:hypothetical protein MWU58_05540 [Flavobacteriaceae bacterium S0825]|uniref:hypothetical protein n=1 Tax=Gaetbulibacter sp. S0825 TaxID=2720084 RepID=UPI001431B4D3|nr:hypothetical protein [Gaetbulibacter sp. S0825]MCK0108745.1 hypothetical protein [Flavobacteriaceae bacterium S0825]NIX64381.1 hypothetical protein [Gaetbulibacter sp. S0825]
MQVLKRLFDFYINSSIHVALAVCGLVWVTLLNFNVGANLDFIYFIFFATVTGYNFVKYFGLAKFHHRSLASWLKAIQIFSFLCFLGLCYFTFKLKTETLFYFTGLGVVTFLYAIPFLPKKIFLEAGNLRAISGLKIYVIAFVWMCVTVIIPLLNEDYNLNNDVLIEAIQRYFYVIIAMLPFEIRDMRYDSLKLSTIPQRIGIARTKIIGILLTVLVFLLEFFKDEFWLNKTIVLGIICMLLLTSLLLSNINQKKYFSGFWVEGIPILWAILVTANY